jgi:hypothetical protein
MIALPVSNRVRANYQELINPTTDGPDLPQSAISGRREWIAANEEAVRRFARAYVQGVQRVKTDRDAAYAVYRHYIQNDDPEFLEALFSHSRVQVAHPPYLSEPGLARVIENLAREDPRLVGRQPAEFMDSRYVRELEDSGFLAQALATDRQP